MGQLIMYIAGFALFVVDMLSLYALNLEHGLMWAVVAFFVVPLQVLVPFLVGTWPAAIAFTALFFLGGYLEVKREEKNQ